MQLLVFLCAAAAVGARPRLGPTPLQPQRAPRDASPSTAVLAVPRGGDAQDFARTATPVARGGGAFSFRPARKIQLLMLMSDTGGGHRASANALAQALHRQHPGKFEVTLMDIWSESGVFPWNTAPSAYRFMGKRPWLWRFLWYSTAAYPLRAPGRLVHDFQLRKRFKSLLLEADPDVIVSVHPMCQHVPLSARDWLAARENESVVFATVVTDLGSAHPMWFDSRVDACFVPTQRLVKLGKFHGVPDGKIVNHGLPLRAAFCGRSSAKQGPLRKALARRKLGLDFARTVLVTGGGDGFGALPKIVDATARELSRLAMTTGKPLQLVVICGRNERVRRDFAKRDWAAEFPGVSVVVKGFVKNMETWMAASDVLLTKAGPGTIAEAAALGLPVLLTGFLPGQERGNVQWVVDKKFGALRKRPRAAARTLAGWLRDGRALDAMSANALASAKPMATDRIAADLWDLLARARR